MSEQTKAQSPAAVAFEPNEHYERLAVERREGPARFDRSYGAQTRAALDAYERAKEGAARRVTLPGG